MKRRRFKLRRRYGRSTSYGDKRDYPKIELYYDGEYKGTTTWARTCREAKEKFIQAHPRIGGYMHPIDPSKVKAFKVKS